MPDPKKEKLNEDLDGSMQVLGYSPEAIAARELAMVKGLGGGKKAKAALGAKQAIKKVAAPIEAATYAVEALRLATDGDLREKRMDEAMESSRKGAGGRMWDAFSNPVGTLYAAGQAVADMVETNAGQADRDAAYEAEKKRLMERSMMKRRMAMEEDGFERQYDRVQPAPPDDKAIGLSMVRAYLENHGLA